jgi:hypothetical protein
MGVFAIKRMDGLARHLKMSHITVHDWMKHDETRSKIDNYIVSMAAQDKILFYQALRENRQYPRINVLWHKLYDWSDHEKPQGNVFINFNFLDDEKPNTAQDAEFEDVE